MEDAGEDSSETGSFNPSPNGFFGPDDTRNAPKVGIRKVGLRAEIDTSPPFGSVKEAVDHFENSASWIHFHRLRFGLPDNAYLHNIGEIDMKKVEEQTLELEKNLIMKELETLDVLEELGTTKRIVEDLKWQLRKEALKSIPTPDSSERVLTPTFEELKGGNSIHFFKNDGPAVGSSSPCPNASPDMLLLELNQAKMNLGKTINELGWIQSSVESLNKKIKKEKALLERNHQRLTSNPAGASVLRDEPKQQRMKPSEFSCVDLGMLRNVPNNAQERVDESSTYGASQAAAETQQMNPQMKTAEMRLIAAKKMEEAARAAEAVALAEIKALSSQKDSLDFPLPEPETLPTMQSPLPSSKPQKKINLPKKNAEDATVFQVDGANNSKLGILKKLEDASEEVKLSRQALEEALKRIDIANRKQLAAGEALRTYSTPPDHHPQHPQLIDMNQLTKPQLPLPNEETKPVLRSTISMRDVLNRKQVLPRDFMERRETESHKVALSQMLNELRQDLSCPAKVDENRRKQYIAQRKRFGFIHISFPLTKQSKKNMPSSDRK